MTLTRWTVAAALVLTVACNRGPQPKEYQLKGQILGVRPEAEEMLIAHEEIPGFMAAMAMPYKVADPKLMQGMEPGDLITGTLTVTGDSAAVSSITKTGHKDLPPPPPATTGTELLKPGDAVPDQFLINEDGKPVALASLKGHRVGLTFMYTRCPMPEFCPLMDKNFATVQATVKKSPDMSDVRLVSISFDPDYDKPEVLKAHAKKLNADPAVWTFLTGGRDDVTQLAARFGLTVAREGDGPGDITHTLRTAVIDPDGKLVTLHTGNTWTPAELIADLKAIPAPAH